MAAKASISKYDHWTDGTRLNRSFAQNLLNECEYPLYITNKMAYELYAQFHASRPTFVSGVTPKGPEISPIADHTFLRMNVRNQLCKMARMGLLIRVRPGVYRWSENWAQYTPEAFALHLKEIDQYYDGLRRFALAEEARQDALYDADHNA